MLKKQRHQIIIDYLEIHEFAKVETLNQQTDSSAITTRRDINELDGLGLIEKVYGGARRIQKEKRDLDVKNRMSTAKDEKDRIAMKAASLISDGQHVFLDAGSSVHAMIPYLSKYEITVYTHGIHHVEALVNHNIKTYLIGGQVKETTLASVGGMALDEISKLHFDIAFMGTNAVDFDFGYSTPGLEEAQVKSKAMEQSEVSYVLADRSKFAKKSLVQFADTQYTVITDYQNDSDDRLSIIKV